MQGGNPGTLFGLKIFPKATTRRLFIIHQAPVLTVNLQELY